MWSVVLDAEGQQISCHCIYTVCGMEVSTLEFDHPGIYKNGPTAEMVATWDATWAVRRMPWAGEWPGVAECREYGLWSMFSGGRWQTVVAGTAGAVEDLNRLITSYQWCQDRQRFIAGNLDGPPSTRSSTPHVTA
jgi:hypothetical protein